MIDITEIAKETGLMHRTMLTPAAFEPFNGGGQYKGGDLQKRLVRMLETLQIALTQRKGPRVKVIYFSAVLGERGNGAQKVLLKAAVENQSAQPMIKVMLSSEEDGEKTPEEEHIS